MNTNIKLFEYWSRSFDNTSPLADGLRELNATRWVRFHSLPDSKRYPETEAEYAILLHRHNSIVSELAPESATLHLITTKWSAAPEPNGPVAALAALGLSTEFWQSIRMHDLGDAAEYSCFWHLYASPITWHANSMDCVFRLAADDRITNLMLFDTASAWLVHPYDGGIDVILESSQKRDALACKYESWLSPREDGL